MVASHNESDSPHVLLSLIQSGAAAQLVASAARLGVADALGDGPYTAKEIAERVGVPASLLRRMLRALTSLGVVKQLDKERFALTSAGSFLRKDQPGSLQAFAIVNSHGALYRAFSEIDYSFKTGKPSFDEAVGTSFFDYFRQPGPAEIYNDAMASYTHAIALAVAATYDFSEARSVVDVGGNNGILTAAILNANPHLTGTIFDLAGGIVGAADTLKRHNLERRCNIATGDFFKAVPEGGDVYMLKSIIHDWNDEASIAILKSCRRAMPAHGKVLLIESLLPTVSDSSLKSRHEFITDIVMLLTSGGQERDVDEFDAILGPAGLKRSAVIPAPPSGHCIVEAVPA